jgi:hypothetical protein
LLDLGEIAVGCKGFEAVDFDELDVVEVVITTVELGGELNFSSMVNLSGLTCFSFLWEFTFFAKFTTP